jgi:ferritin-like metal-binding protein YciE
MAELNARDAKLVQFLNEAHAKEAELEADLTAHISLTQKAPYKKRLQQHLKETRDHKRRVA